MLVDFSEVTDDDLYEEVITHALSNVPVKNDLKFPNPLSNVPVKSNLKFPNPPNGTTSEKTEESDENKANQNV